MQDVLRNEQERDPDSHRDEHPRPRILPVGGRHQLRGNQGRASTAVGNRDQDESSQPQEDQKQPSLRPVQLQLIPVRAGLHAVIHRHGHPAAPGAPMPVPVPHSWGSRMCLYQTIFGTPQNSEIPWPLGCTVFSLVLRQIQVTLLSNRVGA